MEEGYTPLMPSAFREDSSFSHPQNVAEVEALPQTKFGVQQPLLNLLQESPSQ